MYPGTPSLFESYWYPTLLWLSYFSIIYIILFLSWRVGSGKRASLILDILPNDLIWAISIPFCSLKCLQLWHSKARWDLPPTPSSHFLLSCHKLKGTARILEWAALPFSRWSSQPRDQTQAFRIVGGFFTSWTSRAAQEHCSGWPIPSPADLPDPGIKLRFPALQADSLPTELLGKPPRV